MSCSLLPPNFGSLKRSLAFVTLTGAVLVARIYWAPRSLDSVGSVALRDLVLTISLWLLLLGLALGLGRRVLGLFPLKDLTQLEEGIFSISLGLGTIAYFVLALGFIGWLSRLSITVLLVVISLWAGDAMGGFPGSLRTASRGFMSAWRGWPPLVKAILVATALIGSLSFLHALAPPWGYDALMYHLVGPRQFLQTGWILADPANWGINSPFTVEMLFTLGIAFGDDAVPRLIHLTFGILLALSCFTFTRRYFGERASFIALAAVVSAPLFAIQASLAYVDSAQAIFVFLASYAVLIWLDRRFPSILVLAGLYLGLALGTKYNAVSGLAALGLLVLWRSGGLGVRGAVRRGLTLGLPAIIVASPWYLKNWLWLGNPIYPFYFGGVGWDARRLEHLMAFTNSFGTGRSLLDYVLIPWNLYARHEVFGTLMADIDVPSLFFPLVTLALLPPRKRPIADVLVVAGLLTVFWALGSQQSRFLLPAYPLLAAASGYGLSRILPRRSGPSMPRFVVVSLILVLMMLPLIFLLSLGAQHRTHLVLLGSESKRAFLERADTSFEAADFLEKNLKPSQRAILVADDRRYYCPGVCIPAPDHWWPLDLTGISTEGQLCEWLGKHDATHLVLNWESLNHLLGRFDPEGVLRRSLDLLQEQESEGVLRSVFVGTWATVYEARCTPGPGSPFQTETGTNQGPRQTSVEKESEFEMVQS